MSKPEKYVYLVAPYSVKIETINKGLQFMQEKCPYPVKWSPKTKRYDLTKLANCSGLVLFLPHNKFTDFDIVKSCGLYKEVNEYIDRQNSLGLSTKIYLLYQRSSDGKIGFYPTTYTKSGSKVTGIKGQVAKYDVMDVFIDLVDKTHNKLYNIKDINISSMPIQSTKDVVDTYDWEIQGINPCNEKLVPKDSKSYYQALKSFEEFLKYNKSFDYMTLKSLANSSYGIFGQYDMQKLVYEGMMNSKRTKDQDCTMSQLLIHRRSKRTRK